MKRTSIGWGATALVIATMLPTIAIGSDQDVRTSGPSYMTRATPWSLVAINGEQTITLRVRPGYCAGSPKPQIVRTAEKWDSNAVIITVFVRYGETEPQNGTCAGLRLRATKRLKLSRALTGKVLYDGSAAPPKKRGSLAQ